MVKQQLNMMTLCFYLVWLSKKESLTSPGDLVSSHLFSVYRYKTSRIFFTLKSSLLARFLFSNSPLVKMHL